MDIGAYNGSGQQDGKGRSLILIADMSIRSWRPIDEASKPKTRSVQKPDAHEDIVAIERTSESLPVLPLIGTGFSTLVKLLRVKHDIVASPPPGRVKAFSADLAQPGLRRRLHLQRKQVAVGVEPAQSLQLDRPGIQHPAVPRWCSQRSQQPGKRQQPQGPRHKTNSTLPTMKPKFAKPD